MHVVSYPLQLGATGGDLGTVLCTPKQQQHMRVSCVFIHRGENGEPWVLSPSSRPHLERGGLDTLSTPLAYVFVSICSANGFRVKVEAL